MKVFHDIYDNLIKFDNIYFAWRQFRLGKTDKESVVEFEHNLEDNLFCLQRELATLTYQHGGYERFIVHDPKRRVIHKSGVKDRVVHTLAAKKLEEIYQNSFISHSHACQKRRGTHQALKDLVMMCRRQSRNYTRNFWYLKCDVRKFFDNINQETTLKILRRRIKDEKFLWLVKEILESFCCGRPDSGLPLGNFTSQWLGNIYLNELDYLIKHNLRVKNYVRYADDFVLLGETSEDLEEKLKRIRRFLLESLRLVVHPGKIVLKKFSSGIEWVGYKILPHYVILKKSAQKRMSLKLKQCREDLICGRAGFNRYCETVNSYFGQLKHCAGHNLASQITLNHLVYDHAGKIF